MLKPVVDCNPVLRNLIFSLLLTSTSSLWAQTKTPTALPSTSPDSAAITLEQAIKLAKANEPVFRAAVTNAGLAHEDRVQARAALLPGVSFNTGAIYTQPNGTDTGVFISANGPHEYLSQGVVHESLSFSAVADLQRVGALEALARARAEIATRGLVVTVTQSFYNVLVTQQKYLHAQAAADEARKFVQLSEKLENGGEVAHSDVIKAQLQSNDRDRTLQDARLAAQEAKLGLAVLIFPTFTPDYKLVNDLDQTPQLPNLDHIQSLAARNNGEIAAASAAFRASQHEVSAAVGGHLPSLSFDYFYGIDANHYATRTNGFNNLGYQAVATLSFPIFEWGAVQSKLKQAELQRDLARVELSAAQRTALANLQIFYNEAATAQGQIALLRQSLDLAAESLRLTTLRYQAGEATALEVVDAQNSFLSAQDNFDDAEARYRIAVANLQTLTGSF